MKRFIFILAVLLLSACGGSEDGVLVQNVPLTSLELNPSSLSIPVGEDRVVHIEVFSHDTPLVPVAVNFEVSEGGDVVEIRAYRAPFVTLRGLQPGQAKLAVSVGALAGSVEIEVVGS